MNTSWVAGSAMGPRACIRFDSQFIRGYREATQRSLHEQQSKKILSILVTGLFSLLTPLPLTRRIVRSRFCISARPAWAAARAAVGSVAGARTTFICPARRWRPRPSTSIIAPMSPNLTDAYLKHFDAVVQVMPDAEVGAAQPEVDRGVQERRGNGLIKYADGQRPADGVLPRGRARAVSKKAKADWEASLAARPPLQRLPGEVPNYERRAEPVKYQAPLSPADSMRYTQVPADFDLQLFAAEPDIVKPIYMAWDERGRAWVVEARDYPHGLVAEGEPGHDSIKICEDTERRRQGGQVHRLRRQVEPRDLAGVRERRHHRVRSAPHAFPQGHRRRRQGRRARRPFCPAGASATRTRSRAISLAALTTGFTARWATRTSAATVGGKDMQFGQGVYRFKADGSALEFLHQYNNNTWGFGLNEHGDVFGSTANGHPTFYGYLPAHILNPDAARPRSAAVVVVVGGGGGGFRPGYRLDDKPGDATPSVDRQRPSAAFRQISRARHADASQHAECPHGR